MITGLSLSPTWSNFAASIARSIVSALQHPSKSVDQAQYEADEVDSTGKVKVVYRANHNCTKGTTCLQKSKLTYLSLPVPTIKFAGVSSDLLAKVVKSKSDIIVSESRELLSYESDEALTLPMGPMASLESSTRLALRRQDGAFEARDVASALSPLRQIAGDAPYMGPTRTNYDPLRIGNYTYESALSELEAVNVKDKSIQRMAVGSSTNPADTASEKQQHLQERAAPFRAMSALLRTKPELINRAQADIVRRGPAARTLIDALAMTETDQGAEALCALLADRTLPTDWRGAVASGLVRSGNTSEQTVLALRNTLSEPEIRVHALFGLGTIARKLAADGDQGRADATVGILTQLLANKPPAQVAAHALRGISNSGQLSALPVVESYVSSPRVNLRIAAVQALRLMQHEEASRLLVERLLHDRDKSVRRAAASVTSDQEPNDTLIAAMQNAVTSDPDPKVRLQLLKTLVTWLPNQPRLKEALELVKQEDAKLSLRKTAEDALSKNQL